MRELLDIASSYPDTDPESLTVLRRALLQIDREETRLRGKRKLERIAQAQHPVLSPIAQGGLASCSLWSSNLHAALYWARQTVTRYPMTPAALWCATLLVSMYRILGMRRERFKAEGDRFRIMKRIALQSDHDNDRIFALHELRKELEDRDLLKDAEQCREELRDLIGSMTLNSLESAP